VVERWIPKANVRRDLFGCIDVVAVRRGESGVLAIQATTLAHVSARLAKAKGRPELRTWLAAGNRFEVWGWSYRGRRWVVKRVALRGEDLAGVVVEVPPRRPGGRKWRPLPLFDLEARSSPPNAAEHGAG
jgi:hypothetical protein